MVGGVPRWPAAGELSYWRNVERGIFGDVLGPFGSALLAAGTALALMGTIVLASQLGSGMPAGEASSDSMGAVRSIFGRRLPDGATGTAPGEVIALSEAEVVSGRQTVAAAAEAAVARTPPAQVPVAAPVELAVEVRRVAQPLPVGTPVLAPGDRALATLSFYYCTEGGGLHPGGDGGGFCGAMRDGTIVRPGAAACDVRYLGQRFRIEGDPTGRTYVCADTGSAVHGLHRDIWFDNADHGWFWQLATGPRAVIEVVP